MERTGDSIDEQVAGLQLLARDLLALFIEAAVLDINAAIELHAGQFRLGLSVASRKIDPLCEVRFEHRSKGRLRCRAGLRGRPLA